MPWSKFPWLGCIPEFSAAWLRGWTLGSKELLWLGCFGWLGCIPEFSAAGLCGGLGSSLGLGREPWFGWATEGLVTACWPTTLGVIDGCKASTNEGSLVTDDVVWGNQLLTCDRWPLLCIGSN